MVEWPNWIYALWAIAIRGMLFPIVLPIRVYEFFRER